jgi:hypothetical protein
MTDEASAEYDKNMQTDNNDSSIKQDSKSVGASNNTKSTGGSFAVGLISLAIIIIIGILLINYTIKKLKKLINKKNTKYTNS